MPREEKPDILFMSYDEYLDSYKSAKKDAQQEDQNGGGGGGAASNQQQQQQQDVSLMSEEQYLEYCRNFTQQMGMPFDEAMVRRHYQTMKDSYQQQHAGSQQGAEVMAS